MSYFWAEAHGGREILVPRKQARSGWGDKGQIRGTALSGALARAQKLPRANSTTPCVRFGGPSTSSGLRR